MKKIMNWLDCRIFMSDCHTIDTLAAVMRVNCENQ